jgi:ATP-dependent DNA helicase Q1
MLKFAQDLKTCRKIAFARVGPHSFCAWTDEQYFSTSAQLSTNAWDHGDTLSGNNSGSVASCGSCDNCLRDPSSIITKDVTLETWRILKVVKEVERNSGRATLSNVSDLVRGLGSASYTGISAGGNSKKRKADPEKVSMDTASVAGGKVTLNKEVGPI